MYQIVERLIMKSPFLMGMLSLGVIFMYLRFVLSLFSDFKECSKKEQLIRGFLILLSPLVVWLLISLNSSSLDSIVDDKTNEELQKENKENSMRRYMDSIMESSAESQARYQDSVARYQDSVIKKIDSQKDEKLKKLEEDYKYWEDDLLTKTATSPEIRDAWDETYAHAIDLAMGDIEQAKNDLRDVLKDELSDIRLLEKYFENVEAVKDDLGNWKIVSKKRKK